MEEAIEIGVRAKELDIRLLAVTKALKMLSALNNLCRFAVDGSGSRLCRYLLRFDPVTKLQNCFCDLICLAFTELGIHWQ